MIEGSSAVIANLEDLKYQLQDKGRVCPTSTRLSVCGIRTIAIIAQP
jgi:hypothetical protein